MPSGPKKRRSARKKKEREEAMKLLIEMSKDVIHVSASSITSDQDDSVSENVESKKDASPVYQVQVESDAEKSMENQKASAEDAVHLNIKVTQENPDELGRESEFFVSPSDEELSKMNINDTAKMTQDTVDSDPNGTVENVINVSPSSNADQEVGSHCGNVVTIALPKLEVEPENEAFSEDDKGIHTDDSNIEESKKNEEVSKPETSTSIKEDSSMSVGQEKRIKYMYSRKKKDSNTNAVAESARESEVFVTQIDDELSKNSINDADATKMTQITVDSDPNGICALPCHPAHVDSIMSKDNVEAPFGAEIMSVSATSVLSDCKGNEEVTPLSEANFVENLEASHFIEDMDKCSVESMDVSFTKNGLVSLDTSNSVSDISSAAEENPEENSDAVLVQDDSRFIPKQDDDDDAFSSATVYGVETGDKENVVDNKIQNDKATFNFQRDASPSYSQVDDQEAPKSAISIDDLSHNIPLLSSSGYVLFDLVGRKVIHEGKILTAGVQIDRVKTMLEEELRAADKLRAALQKLLNDLEAV